MFLVTSLGWWFCRSWQWPCGSKRLQQWPPGSLPTVWGSCHGWFRPCFLDQHRQADSINRRQQRILHAPPHLRAPAHQNKWLSSGKAETWLGWHYPRRLRVCSGRVPPHRNYCRTKASWARHTTGFPSRRGLTPRGSLECNPEIPAFPGEEN